MAYINGDLKKKLISFKKLEISKQLAQKNPLKLNADKIKTLRFYKKKSTRHMNALKTENKKAHNVEWIIRYLVILLDKDLNFEQHAESEGKNSNIPFFILSIEEMFKQKAACNSLWNIKATNCSVWSCYIRICKRQNSEFNEYDDKQNC